jgi:hypothetical protein
MSSSSCRLVKLSISGAQRPALADLGFVLVTQARRSRVTIALTVARSWMTPCALRHAACGQVLGR